MSRGVEDVKANLTLYVRRDLVDQAHKLGINISTLFENFLERFLYSVEKAVDMAAEKISLEEVSSNIVGKQIWDYEKAFNKLEDKIKKALSAGRIMTIPNGEKYVVIDRKDLEDLLDAANLLGLDWLKKYQHDENLVSRHLVDTGKEIVVRFFKTLMNVGYRKGARYRWEFGKYGKASYKDCKIYIEISELSKCRISKDTILKAQ